MAGSENFFIAGRQKSIALIAYETNGNGAIFKHWEKNTARYGAARGDETYVNGVYYMDFERGTIRWTAQRGIY